MADLNNTLIHGNLRVANKIYSDNIFLNDLDVKAIINNAVLCDTDQTITGKKIFDHEIVVYSSSGSSSDPKYNNLNPKITFYDKGQDKQKISLVFTDSNNYRAEAGLKLSSPLSDSGNSITGEAWFEAPALYEGNHRVITNAGGNINGPLKTQEIDLRNNNISNISEIHFNSGEIIKSYNGYLYCANPTQSELKILTEDDAEQLMQIVRQKYYSTSRRYGITIASDDLNNDKYWIYGNYACSDTTIAQSLKNTPSGLNGRKFTLDVINVGNSGEAPSPIPTEHHTYLIIGADGRYKGQPGQTYTVGGQTLTNTILFKGNIGSYLPKKSDITSTDSTKIFDYWYYASDPNSHVNSVPTEQNTVLTAAWHVKTTPEPPAPSGPQSYMKITSASDLSDGMRILIATVSPQKDGQYAFAGKDDGKYRCPIYKALSDPDILENFETFSPGGNDMLPFVFTITQSGSSFSIKDDNNKYLHPGKSKNTLESIDSDSPIANMVLWNFIDGSNAIEIHHSQESDKCIKYNASSPRFSAYTTSQVDVAIYVCIDNAVSTMSLNSVPCPAFKPAPMLYSTSTLGLAEGEVVEKKQILTALDNGDRWERLFSDKIWKYTAGEGKFNVSGGTISGNTIIDGKLLVNDEISGNYSGGLITGPLIFNTTDAIQYKGTNATYSLIRFIDNTGDTYGNGIAIGGGGKVAIGAGESAGLFEQTGSGGTESLYLSADGDVHLYSNANNGLSTAKHMHLNSSGTLTVPGDIDFNKVGNIKNLAYNGGIYWNPCVESDADNTDAASITVLKSGCLSGGTELRLSIDNDSQDTINLKAPYYICLNSKKTFQINDSWLRINEDKGFSSGIYTGQSIVRSDAGFQVGSSGNKINIDSNGNLTMAGAISLPTTNSSWHNGRDYSSIKIKYLKGAYSPFMSVGTKDGSWEFGQYDNSTGNDLLFCYTTNAQYAEGNYSTNKINLPAISGNDTIALMSNVTPKFDKSGGTITGSINLSASSAPLTWTSGTYWQRIINVDDSTAGTDIFQFQQSTNGGSSFETQASITDDGGIKARSYAKIGSWKVTDSGGDLVFTK